MRRQLADGFHVHHVDGNAENNKAENLILIEGSDHIGLHSGRLHAGIASWRRRPKKRRLSQSVEFTPEIEAAVDEAFDATGSTLEATRLVSDRFNFTWSVSRRLVKHRLKREAEVR